MPWGRLHASCCDPCKVFHLLLINFLINFVQKLHITVAESRPHSAVHAATAARACLPYHVADAELHRSTIRLHEQPNSHLPASPNACHHAHVEKNLIS